MHAVLLLHLDVLCQILLVYKHAFYFSRLYNVQTWCESSNYVMSIQVKEKAASMMFIELMFWKPAPVAQLVKEEYNWRVWCCPAATTAGSLLTSMHASFRGMMRVSLLAETLHQGYCLPVNMMRGGLLNYVSMQA